MESERAKVAELEANHRALSMELANAKSQELNKRRELVNASDEIDKLKMKHSREMMDLEMDLKQRSREIRELNEELRLARGDLERERDTVSSLKANVSQQSTAHISLTAQISALQAERSALQAQLDAGTSTISQRNLDLESALRQINELEEEVREGESIRRKLHNLVQELKGNIRVFCRVRPILPSDASPPTPDEPADAGADIAFPDKRDRKEIVMSSASSNAMGQERKEVYNFGFDRVFEPHSSQSDVFEEISHLAQSCIDGYNVCIFAYGQTGSGKSFTMEGGSTEATCGMIPRAVNQVFKVAQDLRSKGWEYKMEGQFLEIYNETINDLLGKGEFDKKKHEIKHDKSGTRVTDVNVVSLQSPSEVRSILKVANSRRTVAATLMNERSSRSHSVFTLRISGLNMHTGEQCEGSLNLVDLAGSERLNSSGAASDKERLKETQNINRSLSALGDVIAALGEKSEKNEKHIPYRNSKLTYLLQNSLSGNSKTLMILNLSPLAAHLNESLTSLRFATKVNNTTIGTAKKQLRSSN
ncbi:P-loop containing nucleoside triphosphate hydrolase protein [Hygrophoropsis aurantiaca]|uniref:P-loop containing nucleoside triphosphate hydrolase protein n=1 Tax=Hygrophoropsis aurantiaca TaxID=72124 RepID=A0ACB8AAG4_9AGAM|nr:P-loop containing nucleoside triphosphate hydrolase protein [Hygrophoropsis aurantiaca]